VGTIERVRTQLEFRGTRGTVRQNARSENEAREPPEPRVRAVRLDRGVDIAWFGCARGGEVCLGAAQSRALPERGCGHVPNALRANRAYATRLGQRYHTIIPP
jgi:hypothetical protein